MTRVFDDPPVRESWPRETWVMGLMSGTSLDGIDAALLRSDGRDWVETGPFITQPYDETFRQRLRSQLGKTGTDDDLAAVERDLTLHHAAAVQALLQQANLSPQALGLIGFHGHTIAHDPGLGMTRQIGDGALLAAETAVAVIADFRSRDVAQGGEGAPLASLYHAALAAPLEKPLAVLNVGGVANVTWIGAAPDDLLAFDTGPGNALIDDWIRAHSDQGFDRDGAVARAGRVDEAVLARLLDHDYFGRRPPKSLDRLDFDGRAVADCSLADGAATLTAFTAAAVARAGAHLPAPPRRWLVTGGGRHNPAIMMALRDRLEAPVDAVEAVGWSGDALEAQAFAYLAVRSRLGLPLSLPSTTGVQAPMPGGVLHPAA